MTRTLLTFLILVLVISAGITVAADASKVDKVKPDPLGKAKEAMRASEFDVAIGAIDKILTSAKSPSAYVEREAEYLKALALYYDKKYANSIKACDVAIAHGKKDIARGKKSDWLRKAIFLKARSLTNLRKFKEAEVIYAAEANRLLSEDRKQDIANVFIQFADALATKPSADDLASPPPNYNKAYNLYTKALAMEIGRDLRDKVMFVRAKTMLLAGNPAGAANGFRAYLTEFDPDWIGPVGSSQRLAGLKRENPKPAGGSILEARYQLAESLLAAGYHNAARVNAEDLLKKLTLIATMKMAKDVPIEDKKLSTLQSETRWLLVKTYRMPNPAGSELERAIKTAGNFLETHKDDPYSVVAAWWIAQAYQAHGRHDQAIEAYEIFMAGKNYSLPDGDAAGEKIAEFAKSPAKLADEWKKLAMFQVGQIRFSQKKFDLASTMWRGYVNKYPHGSHWASCQRGIVNAQFQTAIEAISQKKHDEGRKLFNAFLTAHPLDYRSGQILFTIGQVDYARAQKLEEKKASKVKINAAYVAAIGHWNRLVSKYPQTEESSLALYRIGVIQEEKLGDLAKALEAYRKLTWGSYSSPARARVAVMTKKSLLLVTEKTFRTDETAQVKINVRNIEKLTFKQYFLDLDAYFRKTHSIDGVSGLDIDLIKPDKTWEVTIDQYAKYKPLEQIINIPFDKNSGGVCIINVGEDDLEAMTLVIRSDLEIIVKSSRREALVFAQNMRTGKPAKNVDLLLSDGEKVFATGKTGDDGVFMSKFDELKKARSLRVFATSGKNVTSNVLNLAGMGLSKGLAARGYIYTDRPAYQPGQSVSMRGIIRDVVDGEYRSPSGQEYLISVTDSAGRMLWQETAKLSEFGTFNQTMAIDASAPVGNYIISAMSKDDTKKRYSSSFTVKRFKLEKMRLKLDTDRQVYFRGEEIELTILAEYYWSEPVADKTINYRLPDGRSLTGKTDKDGKLVIKYDTTGLRPPKGMSFSASIEGENVRSSMGLFLALEGFRIDVKPSRSLVLAGEGVDIEIKTTAPDGKIAGGKEVTLFVLRSEIPKPNMVLNNVPWLPKPPSVSGEVTVEEKRATTDPKTGKATINLTLKKGGRYILRVTGEDRFEQVITSQTRVSVSDDEDATKLRLFAKSDTLPVGKQASLQLHSRVKSKLALLTYEGETIIGYEIINIAKGYNPIDFDVDHEHFPNFNVSVSVIASRDLLTVSKPFKVERQLNVTVMPTKENYIPGENGKFELTVTDQLGKPVVAELTLALVNEALLSIHPDVTPNILDYFQRSARRYAEFRTASTCNFSHAAITTATIKEYGQELKRIAKRLQETGELSDLGDGRYAQSKSKKSRYSSSISKLRGAQAPSANGISSKRLPSSAAYGEYDGKYNKKPHGRRDKEDAESKPGSPAPRRELESAGRWIGSVVTDARGKAVVEFVMPENTTQWRLVSRGCTVETLVGQGTSSTVTRKDFFVSLKTPQLLQEGDTIGLLARIHNLSDFEGKADLTLRIFGGSDLKSKLIEKSQVAQIGKGGSVEYLFDEIDVPLAGKVRLEITATSDDKKFTDSLDMVLPVRPWGLELADHTGGISAGSETVEVTLPANRKYSSTWMEISVGPDVKRSIIEMALRSKPRFTGQKFSSRCILPRPYQASSTGSDLLAVSSAIAYAKTVNAPPTDYKQLVDRARALVASLVVSQRRDGGWSWQGADSDWAVTSVSFWAMCQVRAQGIGVHKPTLVAAKRYLQQQFTRVSTNDNDARAVILHALSVDGAADFAHVNRLHRERNSLSNPALAYSALTFVNLKRIDFAKEILTVLASKAKTSTRNKQKQLNWQGVGLKKHAWLRDDLETTAIATLAMMRVTPSSPKIASAINYLLNNYSSFSFAPVKSQGPAISALAEYFAKGQFADADFTLAIVVNGKQVHQIKANASLDSISLAVDKKHLIDGKNKVEFRLDGRGKYAYSVTMRGFSADMKDPGSLNYPYIYRRLYQHANLEYRGKPIGASSSSPVANIEIGQHVRVLVDVRSGNSHRSYLVMEEPIPAGMMLVAGSLTGPFEHHEILPGKIVMYFPPNRSVGDVYYELVGYSSGKYRVLPTVIRDTMNSGRMRVGKVSTITVLKPGVKSTDEYVMNIYERYALGTLQFNDGLYEEAISNLLPLFKKDQYHYERDVARMLLWIYTSPNLYDAKRIVQAFEVLRERYPSLEIPFDKILAVGQAYRDIGEFERACLVYQATIDISFLSDINVSAVLEDEGQFLGSIAYQQNLWLEYPDTPQVVSSYFAISQSLYEKAPKADELAKHARKIAALRGRGTPMEKPDRIGMLKETIRLLDNFLTYYPTNPLADDAAFSMANAQLDLKQYDNVVASCDLYKSLYKKSEFAGGFQYMIALGHFWQRRYDQALTAGKIVADSKSKDRDFARYILGQIHHAKGSPADAIKWYKQVAQQYPDAKEAIEYFEAKRINIEEINIFKPKEKVSIDIKYRNIKKLSCQVYSVDLMKLYLREKNLSNITAVNLAGIKPQLTKEITLGNGKDYVDKTKTTDLELTEEGAYLVICRGDDLFTSTLVLITPLKIEVQEDATSGRVRANLIDDTTKGYVSEVHIKAIGSADTKFKSGETDLRGIFVADNIRGKATLIARDGTSRYAFYRGEKWLGASQNKPTRSSRQTQPKLKQSEDSYKRNLQFINQKVQKYNNSSFDNFRRNTQKGVQVDQTNYSNEQPNDSMK